jgi:hypothetical protein
MVPLIAFYAGIAAMLRHGSLKTAAADKEAPQ